MLSGKSRVHTNVSNNCSVQVSNSGARVNLFGMVKSKGELKEVWGSNTFPLKNLIF